MCTAEHARFAAGSHAYLREDWLTARSSAVRAALSFSACIHYETHYPHGNRHMPHDWPQASTTGVRGKPWLPGFHCQLAGLNTNSR